MVVVEEEGRAIQESARACTCSSRCLTSISPTPLLASDLVLALFFSSSSPSPEAFASRVTSESNFCQRFLSVCHETQTPSSPR